MYLPRPFTALSKAKSPVYLPCLPTVRPKPRAQCTYLVDSLYCPKSIVQCTYLLYLPARPSQESSVLTLYTCFHGRSQEPTYLPCITHLDVWRLKPNLLYSLIVPEYSPVYLLGLPSLTSGIPVDSLDASAGRLRATYLLGLPNSGTCPLPYLPVFPPFCPGTGSGETQLKRLET